MGWWWEGVREWRRVPKIGVSIHLRPLGPSVIADLDTLLIALYVELTDQIIPTRSSGRRPGPGRPPTVTDAELVCLAVAQVLLRYHDEHHWLRAAPTRVGHLFPGCCPSPPTTVDFAGRLAAGGGAALAGRPHPGLGGAVAAAGWHPGGLWPLADHRHPVDLAGWAGYGHDTSHHCFYWGARLLLVCTPEGTVTGFGLANPKLVGEREAVVAMLEEVPANRPAPGTLLVGDKGFAGRDFQAALAGLSLVILRPARTDEADLGGFPNWLRQRIEAIIWTLKHQLGLDRPGGRIPAGLWARVVQRLLALNAAIWFNWQIGAPVKRSLIAYDH